jgi:hypothetical protein
LRHVRKNINKMHGELFRRMVEHHQV